MAEFLSECDPSFSESDIQGRCVWRPLYERFPTQRKALARGDRWEWHRHEYCECFWVERGAIVHSSRLGTHRLRPGDIVFLHPDDGHRGEVVAGTCDIINMVIPVAEARALGARYGARWPWARSGPLLGTLAFEERREATRLADDRRGLERGDRDLLLLLLCRGLRPARADAGRPLDDATRAVLEEAAQGGLGAGAAATRLGISPTHLNRRVRAGAGCTTVQWLGRRRIERAAELLRGGRRPVVDIALACHFDGLAHFYRLFRRHYRCSPEAYRREMGAVLPE